MIDLVRLQHIVLVAREGSFIRAARAANMSQPALSRSVQSIERQFDVKIFDRSRTGVVLTRAGQQFLGLAEGFVRRAESLEGELRVVSEGGAGAVPFGLAPLAATLFLPDLADLLWEKGIRAQVRVDNDTALRRLLLDGEIEFYISGLWKGAGDFAVSSRLHVESMGSVRYGLVVRNGHPLAGLDTITPEQMAAFPVVGSSPIRRILDDEIVAASGLRYPSLEVDNYDLLIEIVKDTDAVLLAPPFLTESSRGRGLVVIKVDLPEGRANIVACVIRLQDKKLTPGAEMLANRLSFLLRRLVH